MKDSKTAILIFAHSAEYEAKMKPFQHSKEVFESLNEHVVQLVKRTKLPYFLVTEKEQKGSSFAERFTNAIQSIYDLGYDSIITIGNDTPHLTTKKLLRAKEALLKKDVVLGKSTDGGFYLLGIKKQHFNPTLLLKLPWQNHNPTRYLKQLFVVQKIEVFYLETLNDIDKLKDISLFINSYRKVYSNLHLLLLQIIFGFNAITTYLFEEITFLFQSKFYNKGSPCSI